MCIYNVVGEVAVPTVKAKNNVNVDKDTCTSDIEKRNSELSTYSNSDEFKCKLIQEVQKHPILWDTSLPDFKDLRKKQNDWKEIALSLSSTCKHLLFKINFFSYCSSFIVGTCQRVYMNLRYQYCMEIKAAISMLGGRNLEFQKNFQHS